MSGFVAKENNISVEVKALQVENAQLKAKLVQLKQRMERLEKSLEEALGVGRILPAVGLSSSSSLSSSLALHPSSPLLASPVSRSRDLKIEVKEVELLLQHVAYGEQDEAEALIQKKPRLLLCKGSVTDLSKREFKAITAFQYALWALDWHMWRMLLKYMAKEEAAAEQFVELEEKGTAHGKHFSLSPLIEALNTNAKNYDVWNGRTHSQHWYKEVGGSQSLLPVHVANEYCHPSRSFEPCPGFKEETLPRSMKLYGIGDWFTSEYNGGKLGEKFAILRYNWRMAASGYRHSGEMVKMCTEEQITADAEALQSLSTIRQQQLEDLRAELQYFLGAKELLNAYFPPVLSSTVLGYLG